MKNQPIFLCFLLGFIPFAIAILIINYYKSNIFPTEQTKTQVYSPYPSGYAALKCSIPKGYEKVKLPPSPYTQEESDKTILSIIIFSEWLNQINSAQKYYAEAKPLCSMDEKATPGIVQIETTDAWKAIDNLSRTKASKALFDKWVNIYAPQNLDSATLMMVDDK